MKEEDEVLEKVKSGRVAVFDLFIEPTMQKFKINQKEIFDFNHPDFATCPTKLNS